MKELCMADLMKEFLLTRNWVWSQCKLAKVHAEPY